MKGILRADLRKNVKSYAATALAIALAVAFLLTCLGLTEGLKMTLARNITEEATGADLIVSTPNGVPYDGEDPEPDYLQKVADQAHKAHPEWKILTRSAMSVELSANRKTVSASLLGLADSVFDPSSVVEGKRPSSETEIGIEQSNAKTLGVKVGDTVNAGIYDSAIDDTKTVPLKVSGIYKARLGAFPTSYVSDSLVKAWAGDDYLANIVLISGVGATHLDAARAELKEFISHIPDADYYEVFTADQYLDRAVDTMMGGEDVLLVLALVFPLIAGVTAIIVVSVTYNVLFARRRRQLALLRAVGATSGQLRSLVARETLLVGAISAVLGVLAGVIFSAIACRIANLADTWGQAFTVLNWQSLLAGFLCGTVISFLAGFSPSRRVAQVTPIEALATEDKLSRRRKHRTVRAIFGSILFFGGTTTMIYATLKNHQLMTSVSEQGDMDTYTSNFFLTAMFAGMISFLGLVLLTSIVLPYVTSALGVFSSPAAVTWRLAAENTGRNPRRTGATGAALTLGITLMVLLLVGAASVDATGKKLIDEHTPVDLQLVSEGEPLSQTTIANVKATSGLERTIAVNGLLGSISPWGEYEKTQQLLSQPEKLTQDENGGCVILGTNEPCEPDEDFQQLLLESKDFSAISHSRIPVIAPGHVGIPQLSEEEVGKPYAVRSGDKVLKLTAEKTPLDFVSVSPQDLAGLASSTQVVHPAQTDTDQELGRNDTVLAPRVLLMRISPDCSFSDIEQLASDIPAASEQDAYITGSAPDRAMFTQITQGLMWGAFAMLGVSVLVALVGVANTLALSVMERRRENGMLRALGMTKGRLQGMLAIEALLTALGALVVGVLAGLGYAIAGINALPVTELASAQVIVVPPLAIAAAALTIVVALLASIGPARAAARVTPVEALAHD